jgi:translation initiation factor IF-2
LKIRIFALAKELGMDSKVLIDCCNKAGVQLKPSPLASISPEERDIVLNYLKKDETVANSASDAPPVPVREATRDVDKKLRQIKTMAPRPQPSRPSFRPTSSDAGTASAGSDTIVAEKTVVARKAETDLEPVDVEAEYERDDETAATLAEETTVAEPAIEAEIAADETETDADQEAAVEQPIAESKPTEDRPAADAGESAAAEPKAAEQAADEKKPAEGDPESKIVPMSRDDYIPSAGTASSSIREMKPRGTSDADMRPGRRGKGKAKPALPSVAAPPTYKAPARKSAKPEEGPAQKPDMRLTKEILENKSPLAAHLRKHAEDKKKRVPGEEVEEAKSKRGARGAGNLGLAEGRQQRREKRKSRRVIDDEGGDDRGRSARRPRLKRQQGPVELKSSAQIELPITIRSLSETIGRPASNLLKSLMKRGLMLTINETLEEDVAVELAMELGVDLEIKRERDIEEELQHALESDGEMAVTRPPVVTILGHVDHGKTTLLDKIRSTNVAGGEAGGITQHIASYQVEYGGHKLTFVDTPGHAAFGEMRARGANVTDIVVLVVAADDGVMPQTVECISHAKAAGVPMVVAMNKIDLADVNEQRVLQELASHNVLPAEWGGDVEVVRTSATTGRGIDDLLETLLLTAELHEFKTDPDRPGVGACLEAFRSEGRGAVAWLLVQKGALRVGDVVLCGEAYGRIRAMYNDRDEEVQEAGPSTPVKVAGLDIVPGAGDHFFVMSDLEEARTVAENRRHRGRTAVLSQRGRPRTMEDILNAARGGAVQDLQLILKADTPGSIEALKGELDKFEHPEVRVNILHTGVGGVNESDVYLASASNAIIVAFHVIPEDRAVVLAEREGVDIRRYNIIYEVTDDIKRSLEGLLRPERVEVMTGRALVLRTFSISRFGTIAGCRILNGTIERSNRMRVIRDQKILHDYNIASLKREKDDAKEVREGMECGIRLDGFNDVKEGDLFEAFRIEEVKRTLD